MAPSTGTVGFNFNGTVGLTQIIMFQTASVVDEVATVTASPSPAYVHGRNEGHGWCCVSPCLQSGRGVQVGERRWFYLLNYVTPSEPGAERRAGTERQLMLVRSDATVRHSGQRLGGESTGRRGLLPGAAASRRAAEQETLHP